MKYPIFSRGLRPRTPYLTEYGEHRVRRTKPTFPNEGTVVTHLSRISLKPNFRAFWNQLFIHLSRIALKPNSARIQTNSSSWLCFCHCNHEEKLYVAIYLRLFTAENTLTNNIFLKGRFAAEKSKIYMSEYGVEKSSFYSLKPNRT